MTMIYLTGLTAPADARCLPAIKALRAMSTQVKHDGQSEMMGLYDAKHAIEDAGDGKTPRFGSAYHQQAVAVAAYLSAYGIQTRLDDPVVTLPLHVAQTLHRTATSANYGARCALRDAIDAVAQA